MISITQFEFFTLSSENLFNKTQASLNAITMKEKNVDNKIKSYEIHKIIAKRQNRKRNIEYLIRWLDYKSKKDF